MSEYTPKEHEVRARSIAGARESMRMDENQAEAEFDRWLAAHDRQVAAKALTDAAKAIRREAGGDECAMADVVHESLLPRLSKVMLNGVTRAAERLNARAAAIVSEPSTPEGEIR